MSILGTPITNRIKLTVVNPKNVEESEEIICLHNSMNVFGTGACSVYLEGYTVYIVDKNYIQPIVWKMTAKDWFSTDKTGM